MPVSMLSTSLFSDRKSYSRFNALDTIYTPPSTSKPGMVLMKPTSIAHSGTSATLGTSGQVTFNAVTSLSLNGCFTADFDNYVVSIRHSLASGSAEAVYVRLRAAGSDASGTDYTYQQLSASSTSVTASRSTSQDEARITNSSATVAMNGTFVNIYGPALAQPTAFRDYGVNAESSARILDYASTHSLSTSYDGITFIAGGSTLTGAVQVYGVRS